MGAMSERQPAVPAQNLGILTFVDNWDPDRYFFVRILRRGGPYKAQLELYADMDSASVLAVKRYTSEHLCDSPEAFSHMYPGHLKNPWNELVFVQNFSVSSAFRDLGVTPYRGLFRDPFGDVLVVSDHMPLGDLFDFIGSQRELGAAREALIQPILHALLSTVSSLHSLDVAHCDVSVENVLLKLPPKPNKSMKVVLIDFGMALCGEQARAAEGVRAKKPCQAPELHKGTYNAFYADLFACGVIAFALALGRHPWASTVASECASFAIFQEHGFAAFLEHYPVPGADSMRAADLISPGLVAVIATLLDPDPRKRGAALDMMLR